MNKISVYRASALKLVLLTILAMPMANILADVHPQSAKLNYSQKALSNFGNSAAAAMIIERDDPHVLSGGMLNLSVDLEYGNFDDLFEKLNDLANDFKPPADDGGDSGGGDPGDNPGDGGGVIDWDDIFLNYPELEDKISAVKDRVTTAAALLAVIAAEGYGKAEASIDGSFILSEQLFDGTLLFGFTARGSAKVLGIFERPFFDFEIAKTQLAKLPDYSETDPIQELDLSGGVTLFYNPANMKTKLTFDNDSLLLVKASKISQLSLSYSHKALTNQYGDLYWGIKPIYYRIGLANVGVRLGDLTDSEAIFDDIKNAEYVYKNGFDFDLGLIWAAEHYQLGASLKNVIEQRFDFPELDRRRFSSANILGQLDHHESITLERQLKLEAGIYSQQRHWSLHAELDANAITDQMKDKYQWLTISGGYAADSWWLPSARIGFSKNLTGSKLSYLNAGVTVMKFLNIDVAATLDKVHIDGNELMRGLSINLGVQFAY